MSKILISAFTALILSVSMQASATYNHGYKSHGQKHCSRYHRMMGWCGSPRKKAGGQHYHGSKHRVPELSAAAAPVSIALVTGLLAFGLERRRKTSKK